MALKGSRELRQRLKAIRTVFKPVGREWGERTVTLASRRVRKRSGKTARTIRVKNASQRRAAVEARGGARFLEAGAAPHELKARRVGVMKFNVRGQPMFARKAKHPGMRPQPFMHRSARDALADTPILGHLIDLWNRAA